MSFFDDITRSALGALTGSSGGNPPSVVTSLITELITKNSSGNGLAGFVQQFVSAGLGTQAASWVSTGENIPITGAQVNQALGADQLAALAQKTGLPAGQLSELLAQFLPRILDQLTPNGQVPQGAGLESALGGLLQSGFVKSLLGQR